MIISRLNDAKIRHPSRTCRQGLQLDNISIGVLLCHVAHTIVVPVDLRPQDEHRERGGLDRLSVSGLRRPARPTSGQT
jgi:hypothetical protein